MKTKLLLFIITILCLFCITITNGQQQLTGKTQFGFIENKGQIHDQDYHPNPSVKYLLPLNTGMNVQLKANSFSYDTYIAIYDSAANTKMQHQSGLPAEYGKDMPAIKELQFHRVDIALAGSNPAPRIIAENASSDYLNYYTATTPETGVTSIRHYGRITYKDIYPGIDMVFEYRAGGDKPVEYTFIVHPGADLSKIQLRYTGANAAQLKDGNILLSLAHGTLNEKVSSCWIKETGEAVTVNYRVISKSANDLTIGYAVAGKGKISGTLVIDPTPNLVWGTYYGGNDWDEGDGVSADNSGNVYMSGTTASTASIATTGSYQSAIGGGYDAMLVKFSSAGARQWATYYGGTLEDRGYGVTTDKNGYIYMAGRTQSTAGIASPGAYQTVYGGGTLDGFLVKFNSAGLRQWATYYGGSAEDAGYDVACDTAGNVYLTGYTMSSASIATAGAYQTVYAGTYDVYLVKFSSAGVRQWGTYYGGPSDDVGYGITTDITGNIYITGFTKSTSAIASPGAYQTAYAGGNYDAFIVKFDNTGARQWATYYGGSNDDTGRGISADNNGYVYVTGGTSSTSGIATTGSYQAAYGGGSYDGYLVKFSSSGARQWCTYYGGSSLDYCMSISSDISGNVYVDGWTSSTNALSSAGAYQTANGGGSYDAFLAKFDNTGSRIWGTFYGGSLEDDGWDVSADTSGNVYMTGHTASTSAIASTGAFQTAYGGGSYDAFLAKFGCTAPAAPGSITGSTSACQGQTFTYSISPVTGATSYVWTVPAGSTINSGQGTVSVSVTFGASSGNICVLANSSCGSSAPVCLTINPGSVPAIPDTIMGTTGVCLGQTFIYNASAVTGATSYTWTVPAGATINSGQGTATLSLTFGANPGNICVTANNACGSGIAECLTVIHGASPAAPGVITGIDSSCAGWPHTFSIDTVMSATSYFWTVPAGSTITSGQNTTSIHTIIGNTSGNVCVSASSVCGTGPVTCHPVTTITPYNNEQICMVTVDTAINMNRIIWEKTPGKNTALYDIYKSTGGPYVVIGNVKYDSLNVFIDSTSHPDTQSVSYKIALFDICGSWSALSPLHQTMLLTAGAGAQTGKHNLDWNEYQGFPFSYYYIYRGLTHNNLTLIDSVPAGTVHYADTTIILNDVYYMLKIVKSDSCVATSAFGQSQTFLFSLSNIAVYYITTGMDENPRFSVGVSIYPDPACEHINLKVSADNFTINIYNLQGQQIYAAKNTKEISVREFPAGIYFVSVKMDTGNIFYKKLVVAR